MEKDFFFLCNEYPNHLIRKQIEDVLCGNTDYKFYLFHSDDGGGLVAPPKYYELKKEDLRKIRVGDFENKKVKIIVRKSSQKFMNALGDFQKTGFPELALEVDYKDLVGLKFIDSSQGYPERLRYSQVEYMRAPEDFTRLTIRYSLEQGQILLEEAEKANFLVFAKVIWPDNTESFISLTPTDVTVVRNNHPNRTNVIIKSFYCNLFELWVSKNDADKILGLVKEEETMIEQNESINDQPSDDDVQSMFFKNPADRKPRLLKRAIQIAKDILKEKPLRLKDVHAQLIEEEKGKSDVSEHTLKYEVKLEDIKKELRKEKSEKVN